MRDGHHTTGQYEIRLLGPFTVLRDGEQLPPHEIGSRKARTLLKLLLADRERVVGVDTLADALWPDKLPEQPERHVATLVSRLRAALGTAAVTREGEGYRFHCTPAHRIDLAEVERLVAEAETRLAAHEPALARSATERATALLERGEPFADEPYAEWATPARAAAAALASRVRRCGWAAAMAMRDLDAAARAAEAALAAEPFDEDACRALMRAHRDNGSPGLALAAYERLRVALAEELGTDPAAQTRQLHLEILRAEQSAAAPPGEPPPARRSDLVGRATELARLRQVWSGACAGEAGLMLLAGEAGIGKTRLAAEVVHLAEATGGIVASARCYDTERSLFLQPVADALRPLVTTLDPELVRQAAGRRAGSLAELIAEVGTVTGVDEYHPASPEVERRRLFEAVTGFVRSLGDQRPVLLFLDDLHEAGSATWELLHFLLRRVSGSRVLALATVRVEEGAEILTALSGIAQRCDVGPLAEEAVRELAEQLGLGDLAGKISAQTRGHTLAVVETLRAMREQPADPHDLEVPDSLRAAVVARIRRAGAGVEELLQAAATLGGSIDPALLAALLDEPLAETARRATAASRARLLTEAGAAYEFANDLIEEITYQATPLPLRIAHHRRAAALLVDNPEAVAVHASRAGDWAAALEALLRAAEEGFRRYAYRDAERLLEQAIQAAVRADEPTGVARARLQRSLIREALADYQGAYEDQTAVVELARSSGRRDLELSALYQLGGDVPVGIGRSTKECIPYLESALALAEDTRDVARQVEIQGRLAVIWTNRLRFDVAQGYAQRAGELADAQHDLAVRAVALDAAKTTLAYQGEVAELEHLLPRLRTNLPPGRHQQYVVWAAFEAAFPALARADWSRATAQVEQAVEMLQQSGYPAYQAPFLAHQAWIARAQGRYDEALHRGGQAARIAAETGHPWWVALSDAILGWALTEIGAVSEAVTVLERGAAAAERDQTEGYLVRCLGHLAWACALAGELDRAAALARRVARLIDGVTGGVFLHGAHAVLAAVQAQLIVGDPAAGRLLDTLGDAPAAAGWREFAAWSQLLRARCRQVAGDPDGAAYLARAALRMTTTCDLPGLAWQAHAVLGATSGTGAPGDGPGHAAAARSAVQHLAGRLEDTDRRERFRAHAERTLHAIGGSGGDAGGARYGGDGGDGGDGGPVSGAAPDR